MLWTAEVVLTDVNDACSKVRVERSRNDDRSDKISLVYFDRGGA